MAISKERLKELIEQEATIYKKRENIVFDYNLKKGNYVENNELMYCNPKTYYEVYVGFIEDLFETKEDAEWHKEFGNIPSTEFLKLPTWGEFSKWDRESVNFYHNGTKYSMYVFVKNKNTNNCRIIIYADDNEQDWLVFEQPLTKENYIKACQKCKDLFLGGENNGQK